MSLCVLFLASSHVSPTLLTIHSWRQSPCLLIGVIARQRCRSHNVYLHWLLPVCALFFMHIPLLIKALMHIGLMMLETCWIVRDETFLNLIPLKFLTCRLISCSSGEAPCPFPDVLLQFVWLNLKCLLHPASKHRKPFLPYHLKGHFFQRIFFFLSLGEIKGMHVL